MTTDTEKELAQTQRNQDIRDTFRGLEICDVAKTLELVTSYAIVRGRATYVSKNKVSYSNCMIVTVLSGVAKIAVAVVSLAYSKNQN